MNANWNKCEAKFSPFSSNQLFTEVLTSKRVGIPRKKKNKQLPIGKFIANRYIMNTKKPSKSNKNEMIY